MVVLRVVDDVVVGDKCFLKSVFVNCPVVFICFVVVGFWKAI